MHRLPGVLERETADMTAMSDHQRTDPSHAYTAIRTALWPALHHLGFDGGNVLIQGDGARTLLGQPAPTAHHQDFLTARLTPATDDAAPTRPTLRGGEGDYDLVIASLPWADVQMRDPARWSTRLHRHLLMTIAATRLARPGALTAVLTTHDLMDTPNSAPRRAILMNATFLGAVRLPAGALRPQAGTDNVTDLVLLRTRTPEHTCISQTFEPTVTINVAGEPLSINQYFDDYPDQLLGSIDVESNVWGPPAPTVTPENAPLADSVRRALTALTETTAPATAPTASGQPDGDPASTWTIESTRRHLPQLLDVDAYRGPTPSPGTWRRPSIDPPAVGL